MAKAKETRMVVEQLITRAKNAVASEGDKWNVCMERKLIAKVQFEQDGLAWTDIKRVLKDVARIRGCQ